MHIHGKVFLVARHGECAMVRRGEKILELGLDPTIYIICTTYLVKQVGLEGMRLRRYSVQSQCAGQPQLAGPVFQP